MITRFAGGAPHRGRPEAVCAPERIRTSDLGLRTTVRFQLRYEGMVQAEGLEPPGLLLYRQRRTPDPYLRGDRAELNRHSWSHNPALYR